ncbi:CMGC/CDK/CDK7 protein kinase [Puccinia sorghi]|uniref:[RNA-polymerase]-subunit kinase n=1 Tax=Puccinia sorghi TaxID=27349 RepID=A0A0L6V037_9BASI|nr:CMGC/CDK/CDK7 protein kinase [Puccinia sorghi]
MEAAELANLRIQQSYTKERKIGEGTYASVYEGHQKKSNRKVAIKKIKVELSLLPLPSSPQYFSIFQAGQFKDGLDMSAIREVKFLQELSHPNVIGVSLISSSSQLCNTRCHHAALNWLLLDVFSSKSNLNLVLEFLDTDLEAVIKDRELVFQASDIKSWMLMTMQGLDFCHQNWVLHRVCNIFFYLILDHLVLIFYPPEPYRDCDMKPNNLLIASDGTLKIADFGLAREFADPGTRMTCQVVTRCYISFYSRWYRPPELLYGARAYSTGVDIWAVGCIFAELMLRTPYLAGENDFDQLNTIFRALGTPTEQEWPVCSDFVFFLLSCGNIYMSSSDHTPFWLSCIRAISVWLTTAAGDDAIDFLECCLKFDPRKRINSRQALRHQYFSSTPYPTQPQNLPKPKGALVPRQIAPQDEYGAGGADGRIAGGIKKRKSLVANQSNQDAEMDDRTRKIAKRLDFR